MEQLAGVALHGDGVGAGDGVLIGEELALQTAADQHHVAGLEHDVAQPLGDDHLVLAGADLLDLAQGGTGHHEVELVGAFQTGDALAAQSQTIAVHADHGQLAVLHLEQGAGMDGAALVVGDGEESLGDHGAQGGLTDIDVALGLNAGQLGELLGIGGQNVELAHAAFDIDHVAVGGKDHDIIGHLAHDLAEQSGRQNKGTLLLDLGGDGGLNTGLQIIAGELQLIAGLHQNTLHRSDGTLHGNGAGGDGNGC